MGNLKLNMHGRERKRCKTIGAWLLVGCMAFLLSCEREEIPVPAHVAGNVTTQSVDMGADYRWQLYYDLETNQVVGQNLKSDWDLGFEATADGYHVVLNSAKAMYAWPTGDTAFGAISDTAGLGQGKRWDAPTGNLDSTALGDWRGMLQVYVIDRGYNEAGVHLGFRKLQLQSVDATEYVLRYAALSGAGDTLFQLPKDSAYNLSFFSFADGGKLAAIEPPKHDWDICFTQYLERLPEPYLVTGVLLNRFGTQAVMDSARAFDAIDFDAAQTLRPSSALNTMGYAWKYYHFASATYHVLPQMNYILTDSKGLLYKLHFIDFYNDQGIKGSPKWEYQQL